MAIKVQKENDRLIILFRILLDFLVIFLSVRLRIRLRDSFSFIKKGPVIFTEP